MVRRRQSGAAPQSPSRTIILRWPWWVHPGWILTLVVGSTALVSVLLPASIYAEWRVPKFLDTWNSTMLVVGIASMFAGVTVASHRLSRGSTTEITLNVAQLAYLRRAYLVMGGLSLLGYGVWMASAVSHGVTPSDLGAVVAREAGALSELKASSRPIGGVTTFAQLAPLAVAAGALLRRLGVGGRSYWVFLGLASIRTVFYAERLALFEAIVPLALIAALTTTQGTRRSGFVRIAPLLLGPLAWLLFAASEYMRSWIYYQRQSATPFAEWVSLRLFGYYATSFNNSALYAGAFPPTGAPPYNSAPVVWNAPGLDALVSYPGIHAIAPEQWWSQTLYNRANPEFTSVGSFLVTYGELGFVLMVVFWFGAGLLLGLLFRSASSGSVPALLTWTGVFIGLIELPRFIYWTQGRAFPILAAALIITWTFPRTIRRPSTSGPVQRSHRRSLQR